MKLSFIILNYKSAHHLRICISNILACNISIPFEIIVVDNASGDNSGTLIKETYPTVRFIQNSANLGHPKGNNKGIEASSGEYIALVNPDITFRSGEEIEKIVTYLDQHSDVGLLGPRLHNPDGTIQYSCYRKYSRLTPIFRRTILGKLPFAKKDIQRHLMADFDHQSTIEVEWLLGACIFARRSAVKRVGPLSEKFFLYFGDYEWCDRMRQKGWKVIYFHDTSNIFHYHKRESATKRFSVQQALSYITRVHLRDWKTYLKTKPYDQ